MELSTRWIARYLEIDDLDALAARLTAAGHAVEGRRTLDADGPEDGDVLFDIDITTNRPDCMCHLGMAREAAALLGLPLDDPTLEDPTLEDPTVESAEGDAPGGETADDAASLRVEDFDGCPSYLAYVIRGVRVGPSPDWLAAHLRSIGLRPINNVVDVTNFVLWETGQPLHAFDLATLGADADGKPAVRIRRARAGETLVTLDGEARELTPEMLVIADAERPIALAGVIGGLDTEVTDATVDVLLEVAHFTPSAVRKAAKTLGIKTDAGHRYERGANPLAPRAAGRRAARLIAELAGGTVLPGVLDDTKLRNDWPPRVELDLERLRVFGGAPIESDEVEASLGALGFALERLDAGDSPTEPATRWKVTAPSWRWYDFEQAHAQDVYEEVLRAYGFDRIPATLPAIAGVDAPQSASLLRRRRTQDLLAAAGYAEAIDFAFLDRRVDAVYPSLLGGVAVPLTNPLSEKYDVMRRSLLANLVAAAGWNQRRGADAVRLFEIGHVFALDAEHDDSDRGDADRVDPHLTEREAVALVCGGRIGSPWSRETELDFFDLKGAVDALFEELGVEVTVRAASVAKMLPGTGAEIVLASSERVVGFAGQIDDESLQAPLFGAEILLDALEGTRDLTVDASSRFPGVAVDTTLTHSIDVAWRDLAAEVDAARTGDNAVEDLVGFRLVGRYTGEGVPDGAVNTTLRFSFVAADRSLTQDEVNDRHRRLTDRLAARFGLESRK